MKNFTVTVLLCSIVLFTASIAAHSAIQFTDLMRLYGQPKSVVLEQLPEPTNIKILLDDSEDYTFEGYLLNFENSLLTKIEFFRNEEKDQYDYNEDIFPMVTFNGWLYREKLTPELLFRFIGLPEGSTEDNRFYEHEQIWKEHEHFFWMDYTLYLNICNNEIIQLMVKSKEAAEHMINSQKYLTSPANITYLLTKTDTTSMINLLGEAESIGRFEDQGNDYYFLTKGFALTYSLVYNKFESAYFFGTFEGASKYTDPLPYDLNIDMCPEEVIETLGEPYSKIEDVYYTLFYDTRGLVFAYYPESEKLAYLQIWFVAREELLKNY